MEGVRADGQVVHVLDFVNVARQEVYGSVHRVSNLGRRGVLAR